MANRNSISHPVKVAWHPSRPDPRFPPAWLCWSVWGIGAAFYLTGFYQRVSPAVMTGELMRDFHIGAKQLGNLSAFYFYLYVAMQIPIGILIDRWGAKAVLIGGSISAAFGAFLFGSTQGFALACVGRAILGAASAVGWLVILKLATHWFPSRRFAMLSGLGLFFGNIRGAYGTGAAAIAYRGFRVAHDFSRLGDSDLRRRHSGLGNRRERSFK